MTLKKLTEIHFIAMFGMALCLVLTIGTPCFLVFLLATAIVTVLYIFTHDVYKKNELKE